MRTCLVFALLTWLWTPPASASDPKSLDVPAEKTAEAKVLIAKLDDDDVAVRALRPRGCERADRCVADAVDARGFGAARDGLFGDADPAW